MRNLRPVIASLVVSLCFTPVFAKTLKAEYFHLLTCNMVVFPETKSPISYNLAVFVDKIKNQGETDAMLVLSTSDQSPSIEVEAGKNKKILVQSTISSSKVQFLEGNKGQVIVEDVSENQEVSLNVNGVTNVGGSTFDCKLDTGLSL